MKGITGINNRLSFNIFDKKITVYPSASANAPIIYLNTPEDTAWQIYESLCRVSCPDFTLAAINGLTWNHDMSPWEIPPITKNDTPCTGGADEYLQLLTEEIMPRAERLISGHPLWRGLVGYSLAGLFAIYSLYQTQLFSRVASISGSLWFPEFKEFVFSHEMKTAPNYLYLSLGDRECITKNPYLKTVQTCTEEIKNFYIKKGINTKFELNAGNHFKNASKRTASGICWLLEA